VVGIDKNGAWQSKIIFDEVVVCTKALDAEVALLPFEPLTVEALK